MALILPLVCLVSSALALSPPPRDTVLSLDANQIPAAAYSARGYGIFVYVDTWEDEDCSYTGTFVIDTEGNVLVDQVEATCVDVDFN